MKRIIQAFYSEPVVALGCTAAVTPILVDEGIVVGWIGAGVLAVVAVLQRELVSPKRRRNG